MPSDSPHPVLAGQAESRPDGEDSPPPLPIRVPMVALAKVRQRTLPSRAPGAYTVAVPGAAGFPVDSVAGQATGITKGDDGRACRSG